MSKQWYQLYTALQEPSDSRPVNENQFFQRLITVLDDEKSKTGDKCGAYRDALMACSKANVPDARLPAPLIEIDQKYMRSFGLFIKANKLMLDDSCELEANDGPIDLTRMYDEKSKSNIAKFPIDPALAQALNNEDFNSYNGRAQQMAVRLSLLAKPNSTTIINLPTGTGKTLISHALCLFSPSTKLTLVVVPTTALAIDQGHRAKEMLVQSGESTVANYHWASDQNHMERQDTKQRILNGEQRILFVSPESACKTLSNVLFEVSRINRLGNIVLDEAHMVDEWGSEFRPYYQIFSVIVSSLRENSQEAINCILMSATFTEKSIDTLKGLFLGIDEEPVEIHGGFLRSEIQYSILKVSKLDYNASVLQAVRLLPKPLIVYVINPSDAEHYVSQLKRDGFGRVASFTGNTKTEVRTRLLREWGNDEIDIMVGTSAFGMGVDKGNVRSVLHAGVPPNMDSFYQQVGRGGRDGRSCQSLLIYHSGQKELAENNNNVTLIGAELGLMRWNEMWTQGRSCVDHERILNLSAQHKGIATSSLGNNMWNWKTLLLMQRAGMIRLVIDSPRPPEWDVSLAEAANHQILDQYFNNYYNEVKVDVLGTDVFTSLGWENEFEQRRKLEYVRTGIAFQTLWKWINLPTMYQMPLCAELEKFYTVSLVSPDRRCGGCPGCRIAGNADSFIPVAGRSCRVLGMENVQCWSGELVGEHTNLGLYYSLENSRRNPDKIIKEWDWINSLVKSRAIVAIRTNQKTLDMLAKSIRRKNRNFWIGIPLEDKESSKVEWPELVIVLPSEANLPELDFRFTPRLMVAPASITDTNGFGVPWWEKSNNVSSLELFIQGLL
jgi:ATP-dependent DNA helicase RecQ